MDGLLFVCCCHFRFHAPFFHKDWHFSKFLLNIHLLHSPIHNRTNHRLMIKTMSKKEKSYQKHHTFIFKLITRPIPTNIFHSYKYHYMVYYNNCLCAAQQNIRHNIFLCVWQIKLAGWMWFGFFGGYTRQYGQERQEGGLRHLRAVGNKYMDKKIKKRGEEEEAKRVKEREQETAAARAKWENKRQRRKRRKKPKKLAAAECVPACRADVWLVCSLLCPPPSRLLSVLTNVMLNSRAVFAAWGNDLKRRANSANFGIFELAHGRKGAGPNFFNKNVPHEPTAPGAPGAPCGPG